MGPIQCNVRVSVIPARLQTRQALGVDGSSCQPISLERYQRALSDADKFAAWLTDYHTHVTALGGALQGEVAALHLGHGAH